MNQEYGPLGKLIGFWEGKGGQDMAPAPDRGEKRTAFRERIQFEAMGPVDNHEQRMWALRYSTVAWPEGKQDPFHEELGYWLWDPQRKMVIRSFLVPRGVTILAGGTANPDDMQFQMVAQSGDEVFGICSNPFLQEEFKTVEYRLSVNIHDTDSFTYEEDTVLRIKGQANPFHHTDSNTLYRVDS